MVSLHPLLSLLSVAADSVPAIESFPDSSSSSGHFDGEAVSTAQFAAMAKSPECKNWRPRYNPYRRALAIDLKTHAEGVEAWREYYSRLPDKCQPKPYEMAIADGKTEEEAQKAEAAYSRVFELVKTAPHDVDSYYQEIYLAKTPAEAYLHWIHNRKGWSAQEW